MDLAGEACALSVVHDVTEKRQQEQRHEAILRTSMDGFWMLDLKGNICEVNDAYCDLVGYDRDELLSMNVADLEAVESSEETEAHLRKTQEAGYSRFETRHRLKDGSTVAIEACINYLPMDGGRMFAFFRDITQRKQAEEKLRQSESELSTIYDNAPLAMMLVDRERRVVKMNAPAMKMGQCSLEEIIGVRCGEALRCVHAPESPQGCGFAPDCEACPIRTTIRSGKPVHQGEAAISFDHPDGPVNMHLLVSTTPLSVSEEDFVLVCLEDVTERKRAEEALRESEERYRAIAEDMPVLVCRSLPGGQITYVNQAYCRYFNKTSEELVGQTFLSLIPEADRAAVMANISALTAESPTQSHEHPVTAPNGEIRWQRWTNRAMFDAQGNAVAYQAIGEDITERKQAEKALRESEANNLAMLEAVPDLTFRLSRDGTYLDFHAPYSDELYAAPEDIIGKTVSELLPDEVARQFMKHIERAFEQQAMQVFEYQLDFPDSDRRYFEARMVLCGEDSVLTIVRNVTDRKLAEQALREAHQQLELRVEERTAQLSTANRDLKQEVAERKRAEEALRASEDRVQRQLDELNQLYDSIPVGLCLFDRDLRFLRINERLTAMNGPSVEEHIGRTIEEVLPGLDTRLTLAKQRVIETGQPILNNEFSGPIPADPDVVRHWMVSHYPVKAEDGQVRAVGSVVLDITERKQKEEQIVQQAAVLTAINDVFREALACETEDELGKKCLAVAERLTGSKFGFFVKLNSAGFFDTIAISNPGWDACEMAVSDAGSLIKNMHVRGIDRSTIREGKSRIVHGHEMATHPDRCGTPEGHPPITAFLGVPLKQGEETIGMIGLGNKEDEYTVADQHAIEHLAVAFVEVLRNKRAEGRLDHMQAQLAHVARVSTVGEMVAGIAHEVNQPLCSIRNFTQATGNLLAAEKQVNLDDLREWNAAINRAASHAAEVVKRLRGFVRRTELQRSFCEINEIVNEALHLVAFEAGRHETTVGLELSEVSPTVHVDGRPGCLVTDVRMLGMSGLELQEKLRELDVHLPVVVMTAHATTPLTVRAMQGGALTLLEKPFEENELWDAIRKALAKDAEQRATHERRRELSRRIERLTPTQREVMDLIVAGKSNKWIAKELDVGVRTVESRRREVFEQMQAESLAELVRLAIEASSESSPTRPTPQKRPRA